MIRATKLSLVTIVVASAIVLSSFAWYSLSRSADLVVSVESPVYDVDGIGRGTVFNLVVQNVGNVRVEPSFWVMWSALVRVWKTESGPEVLLPGIAARFTIHSPLAEISVPNGTSFIVKVLDRISGIYFRSETTRLNLMGSPPILNPQLRFWTRTYPDGVLRPFGWGVGSQADTGDSVSVEPANESGGARIVLHEDGVGESPTYQHVSQVVGGPDIAILRRSVVTLCWTRAINYVGDPTALYPLAASGIELRAGGKLAWYALSSNLDTVVDLPNHRIFVARVPVDQPGCASIPIAEMIDFLGGASVDSLVFVVLAVVWPRAFLSGDYEFTVTALTVR